MSFSVPILRRQASENGSGHGKTLALLRRNFSDVILLRDVASERNNQER